MTNIWMKSKFYQYWKSMKWINSCHCCWKWFDGKIQWKRVSTNWPKEWLLLTQKALPSGDRWLVKLVQICIYKPNSAVIWALICIFMFYVWIKCYSLLILTVTLRDGYLQPKGKNITCVYNFPVTWLLRSYSDNMNAV